MNETEEMNINSIISQHNQMIMYQTIHNQNDYQSIQAGPITGEPLLVIGFAVFLVIGLCCLFSYFESKENRGIN